MSWLTGALQKLGHDVIKKRMADDGHLVGEHLEYIRTRTWGPGAIMVWDRESVETPVHAQINKGIACLEFFRQEKTVPKQAVPIFPLSAEHPRPFSKTAISAC